jgi:uncharacterized membrane protein
VRSLVVPHGLRRGVQSAATAVLFATRATEAAVTLREKETQLQTTPVQLVAGVNLVRLPLRPDAAGLVRYEARVNARGDELPADDTATATAEVAADASVLLVDPHEDELAPLAEALRAQGTIVELRTPDALPTTIDAWSAYDVVVFSEVPPDALDRLSAESLESYVANLGGGLMVISGPPGVTAARDATFGRMLPVELSQTGERQVPPVALALLIDRSGSMAGERLESAKTAALAAVEALPPESMAGVVAFDVDYRWIVPMQRVHDRGAFNDAVGDIGGGGGTRFTPALTDAYFTLRATDAITRHVVLLTDGLSTDGDELLDLAHRLGAAHLTLSTVAIGRGADRQLLARLAADGGGRFYWAASPQTVPRIFVNEARLAASQSLEEQRFRPRKTTTAPELDGVDFSTAPPLNGLAGATPKASSEILLTDPAAHPLLVRWRYGLGRVGVFTSDAKARWARDWLQWSEFGRFWSQLLRATMRDERAPQLATHVERSGGTLHVRVELARALASDTASVTAVISDAHGVERRVPLVETGPALHEGDLAPAPAGELLVRAIAVEDGRSSTGAPTFVDAARGDIPQADDNVKLLEDLARVTGGHVWSSPAELSSQLRRNPPPKPHRADGALLIAALCLFVVDVFLKRVRL